jgi:multidrug transporter EmrE-like cation transporter
MLYGAGAVLWLLVLARADLSYAYPLISLGFVVAAVFAHFVMGESLSTARIVGILLICGGVVAIARS